MNKKSLGFWDVLPLFILLGSTMIRVQCDSDKIAKLEERIQVLESK